MAKFTTVSSDYKNRIGEEFLIIGEVDKSTYDYEDVGDMYYILFSDGVMIEAFPEEIFDDMWCTACV